MPFSENWLKAYNARDRDALAALIDDDFVYVRHQSGKDIAKEEMVSIWSKEGPRPERRNFRVKIHTVYTGYKSNRYEYSSYHSEDFHNIIHLVAYAR